MTITVSSALLLVLGGLIGVALASLAGTDGRSAMVIGALLGLLAAVVIVAGEERKCPICKSKNLRDVR